MSKASDYLENAILAALFNKSGFGLGTLSAPPSIYVALCTVAPTDASTGTTIVEANYTGYARKLAGAADFNNPAGGSITNGNDITFAKATGGASVVTHVALVDASSLGNMLFWAPLTAGSLSVSTNITPRIVAGALVVTAD